MMGALQKMKQSSTKSPIYELSTSSTTGNMGNESNSRKSADKLKNEF